jgi:hypothetical protein
MKTRLIALSFVLVAAAFQFSGAMTLGAGDALSSFTFRDFSDPEGGLRWSTDRSTIVFPDPGPGVPVRVEVRLSGWRPAGQEPPALVLSASGRSTSLHPGAGAETVSFQTTTSGWWRSDLEVELRSDVFEPGAGDKRRLGVRVEEARLVPLSRGPRIPPVGALAGTALVGLLVAFILGRAGVAPKTSERAAGVVIAWIAAEYAFARPWAAVCAGPLLLVTAALAVAAWTLPGATRSVAAIAAAFGRALFAGVRRLQDVHILSLVLVGIASVVLAYRAQPRIDVDLGSGREVGVAEGFGSFVGKGGANARWAPRGARLDLSDFGGGTTWKIEVAAAIDGGSREVAVLKAGDRELGAALRESTWTTSSMSVPAPFGWRSGLMLTVPGGSDVLRIERVSIDRGASLPSVRVVFAVLAAGLLALVACGAIGLSPLLGRLAGIVVMAGCGVALGFQPLAAIPFVFRFLSIVAAAALLAALIRAIVAASDDGTRSVPGPEAIGAAVAGWIAWITATAFPFYRGGHFVFHSSIAEEIWKGRFMIYYLPFPGSMLSEQAQWGKIVMPHPALYQLLASPLAALPRPWFYFAEKVLLATLFASLVLMASVVARRVFGPRAEVYAAVVFAGLVPGFQLLGLGHLMTILGVWSSSLVLPWLMFKAEELGRFRTWLLTAWLFTFCFLSYTAALLFTGAALVWIILVDARGNFPRARSVFTMLVAASTFAFLLYYVHWSLPFLMESVPKILGGAGLGSKAAEATPILARLALEPSKLSYSYGSMLIPLAGALGLLLVKPSWDRLVLLTWIGILFFVSAIDLFFNFLLKHHYYVMLPVAVGLSGLLTRIEKRWGRPPAIALTALAVSLGLSTAIEVALGLIP